MRYVNQAFEKDVVYMEKILEKIFETDKIAKEKVGVQKERLSMIEEEIAAEKNSIDRKLQENSKKAVEHAKSEMETKLTRETQRIDAHFEETKEQLNASYEQNHEKWVNDLFEEVIK